MEINDILLEWSYRLKKGYPTMEDGKFTDPNELKVLHEILKENGITKMPSFVKSKSPVSDVIVEDDPNQGTLFGDEEMAAMIQNPEPIPGVTYVDEATQDMVRKKFEETMKTAAKAGPLTLAKLYNRISVFTLYLPMKDAFASSGFGATEKSAHIPKQISTKIQTTLESLDPKDYDAFMAFVEIPKKDKPAFPKAKQDNIYSSFKKTKGGNVVATDILESIAETSDTDQSGLGVGMGEYLLALCFSNIFAAKGSGDLALNSSEGPIFEVKGYPARLGETGAAVKDKLAEAVSGNSTDTFEKRFEDLGIHIYQGTRSNGGKQSPNMIKTLVATHAELDSENKKTLVTLVNDMNHYAQSNMGKEAQDFDDSLDLSDSDFNSEVTLQNKLGAQGLNAYMTKHNQQAFIALDFGKDDKANSNGDYLFSDGGASGAAKLFGNHKSLIFQPWSINLTRPRVIYNK